MDDNDKSLTYGVSHVDGVTPVVIKFDGSRNMLLDYSTTIVFNPSKNASVTTNDYPLAKAVSSVDNTTIRPWVVNATTGAVLATLT